jgi:hypothetical protein
MKRNAKPTQPVLSSLAPAIENLTYWPGIERLYVSLMNLPEDLAPILRLGEFLTPDLAEIRLAFRGTGYALLTHPRRGKWCCTGGQMDEDLRRRVERLLDEA